MQGDRSQAVRLHERRAKIRFSTTAIAAIFSLATMVWLGFTDDARALPSFARQTGQPCGTCHTDFPGLTPYGRRFKLLGYTTGGGLYRTTPFSPSRDANDVNALRAYATEQRVDGNAPLVPLNSGQKGWVPPIAGMVMIGDTHTQAPLPPPTDPYKPNDNLALAQFSMFWGGAITNNIGAFAQVTYAAPDLTVNTTPYSHTWSWDNVDVRYANTGQIGSLDLIYGITANNSPSVQDPWNTTPAWSFPYINPVPSAAGANGPSAGTMIEGAFAQAAGGVGAYTMINDLLYLEASVYRTLDFKAQNTLGVDPTGTPGLFNYAPYWRAALEPHWGRHSLMVGTFGMTMDVHPWADGFDDPTGPSFTQTISQSNRYTDIGFDTQYQYQGDNFWLTLRGSYIREFQNFNATFNGPASISANPTDTLDSMRLYASLALGGDNRVVLTGQYFNTRGSADSVLYSTDANGFALTPKSDGFTGELAYIPFGVSRAPGWPWANARFSLQYTHFNHFNGTALGAQDNNTLLLHAWFVM